VTGTGAVTALDALVRLANPFKRIAPVDGEPQPAGERRLGDEREILLLLGRQPEPGERDLGPSLAEDLRPHHVKQDAGRERCREVLAGFRE
jgi:hypothetical protein